MTVLSIPQPRQSSLGFLFVLFCAAVIGGITFAFFDTASFNHGKNNHPGDEEKVRECLAKGGAQWAGWNKSENKFAFICVLDDGRIGFRSVGTDGNGGWWQKTSFPRDSARSVGDVVRYLENTGYTKTSRIQGATGSPARLYQALLDAGILP